MTAPAHLYAAEIRRQVGEELGGLGAGGRVTAPAHLYAAAIRRQVGEELGGLGSRRRLKT